MSVARGLALAALAVTDAGCEGCLGIDDYTLVPGDGGVTTTTTTSSDTGTSGECDVDGRLFVSAMVEASSPGGDRDGACAREQAEDAGIEVRAFDVTFAQRTCAARTRIVASPGGTLSSSPRVRFSTGSSAYVAAAFHGGALALPDRCATGEATVLEEPAGAAETLLFTKLRLDAGAFCTEWARLAWTGDPSAAGALRLHALETDQSGNVAVMGSLGGASVLFTDDDSAQEVQGGAFFAQYQDDGSLGLVTAQTTGPGDAATAALGRGGQWIVTGTVRQEQPVCYGCEGNTEVLSAAGAPCTGPGGAGGAGGTAGAGGSGGSGGTAGAGGTGGTAGAGGTGGTAGAGGAGGATGTGGSGGGPVLDAHNAFLWIRSTSGGTCGAFHTFGSDRLGDGDIQVGFGVSEAPQAGSCVTYWGGLAGRDPWRLGTGLATSLFDTGGEKMDGYVARFDGGETLGCDGAGHAWNVRLSPISSSDSATVERVSAERCSSSGSVAATALVRAGAGSNVSLYRCGPNLTCDSNVPLVPVAGSGGEHLVILSFGGNGDLAWSAALGPLAADADAGSGTFTARSHHDMARDSYDHLYVVLTTTGPLSTKSLSQSFECEDLVANLSAGTYVIGLRSQGSGEASCDWAHRIE